MSNSLFGWDLLIKSVESEVKTHEDILVCFTHLVLITNNFKCIGLGESKVIDNTETQTEALPTGWSECYALRYTYRGRLYILKCTAVDTAVMINLTRIDERTTSLVQLESSAVASQSGSLSHMLPDFQKIMETIKIELINKVVVSKHSRDKCIQTDSVLTREKTVFVQGRATVLNDGLAMPRRARVSEFIIKPFGNLWGNFALGTGGGGMVYVPRPVGAPHAYVMPPSPPNLRFDPFAIPDIDRFLRGPNRPDNDEFAPPGYDLFM